MTYATYSNNATPNLSPFSGVNEKVAQQITTPTYTDRAVPGKSGASATPMIVRDLSIAYGIESGSSDPGTSKLAMWAVSGVDGVNGYYSGNISLSVTGGIPGYETGTIDRPCFGATSYWIGFTTPTTADFNWAVQNNIESPYVARIREDNGSSTGDFDNDDYAISSSSAFNGQLQYKFTYDIIPTAPLSFTATAVSSTQINLSWSAPASDGGTAVNGYKIQRSTDGSSYSTIVFDTGSTATSYSNTGLTAGQTYYYRVAALNAVTDAFDASYSGPYSAAASDTTSTAPYSTTSTLQIDVSNTAPELTVFGDYAGAIAFDQIQIAYGSENLYNRIVATRDGGTAQVAEYADSQTDYGVRSYSINTLNSTDDGAKQVANELLHSYYKPELRIEAISINLLTATPAQLAQILALEIDDPVEVYFTPNKIGDAIYSIGRIIGIAHNVTSDTHMIDFRLSTVGLDIFVLDSEVSGILDQNLLG